MTLLVASSGGHLTQLRLLAPRLTEKGERCIWVTYDNAHTRSTLSEDVMIPAYGPSTRSIPNAARNLRLALQVYRRIRPTKVVSTGAGIAVPFLLAAEAHGIPAHYIESATRVDSPSLSGRMLQRMSTRVQLHTQYAAWAGDRWTHVGNVLDSFSARRVSPPISDGLSVLVTTGSRGDFPFPSLISRLSTVLSDRDQVTWQLGSTPAPQNRPNDSFRTYIPSDEMNRLLAEVDVVVSHAGVGIVLSSLSAGRRPLVVPRRPEEGEVVDGHQNLLARELRRRDLAATASVDGLTREHLVRASGWETQRTRSLQPLSFASSVASPVAS